MCEDAHLSELRRVRGPDRQLVFDLNDFDETLPGPWEWDVKRLVASFAIAARENGIGRKQRHSIVRTVARSTGSECASWPPRGTWMCGTCASTFTTSPRSSSASPVAS